MCFYCILMGLFCFGEGTKTSGHDDFEWTSFRVHVLISIYRNRQSIDMLVFSHFFFCRTMDVPLGKTNPKTNILPISFLLSFNYG